MCVTSVSNNYDKCCSGTRNLKLFLELKLAIKCIETFELQFTNITRPNSDSTWER